MVFRYFIFSFVLFCSVGSAADARDTRIVLQEKMQEALLDEDSLWVMAVSQGVRYTCVYDVRNEMIGNRWVFVNNLGEFDMIAPVVKSLKNAALSGCQNISAVGVQKEFCVDLPVTENFLDFARYKMFDFSSHPLKSFLTSLGPKLHHKNKAKPDAFGYFLDSDALQKITPGAKQRLRFRIETPAKAVDKILTAKTNNPAQVFMPIPGVGILTGRLMARHIWHCSDDVVHPKSILVARMFVLKDELSERYPFSEDKWKLCLNDKEEGPNASL